MHEERKFLFWKIHHSFLFYPFPICLMLLLSKKKRERKKKPNAGKVLDTKYKEKRLNVVMQTR